MGIRNRIEPPAPVNEECGAVFWRAAREKPQAFPEGGPGVHPGRLDALTQGQGQGERVRVNLGSQVREFQRHHGI
ncbi:MAG: hypothetical protein M0Z27_11450 [Thermaerobacter sp.]|nr:hypothetical protein [Thermaerobacter sp.]